MSNSNFLITTINDYKKVLEKADPYTLYIFDLDDTLIRTVDKALRYQYESNPLLKKIKSEFIEFCKKSEIKDYEKILFSRIMLTAKRSLINEFLPNAIKNLQEKKCKTIALTYMLVGSFGDIPDLGQWRYQQLKEIGFDFCEGWQDCIMNELPENKGSYPLFYKGILMTNRLSKGIVFENFIQKQKDYLSKIGIKKIACFDDRLDWLEEIQKVSLNNNFKYQGYQINISDENEEVLDEQIAIIQFRYLQQKGKWLSDIKAKELL